MFRSLSALGAAAMLVVVAQAQDVNRMQRAIDALSSPPGAEELAALGERDTNAYVYFLQDFLSGQGRYQGTVDGQLTNATIRAIVGFCREAGFAELCIRGPLLPQSIAAVSVAVAKVLAPAVEAVVDAAPETAATPPELPEGWRISENGGRGPIGVTAEVVSSGPGRAAIRFSGTATARGYINVELAPAAFATSAAWRTEVSVERMSTPESGGQFNLLTARRGADGYLGELFEPVPITPAEAPSKLSASGTPTDDTLELTPYIQLFVDAGTRVETTILIADPTLAEAR